MINKSTIKYLNDKIGKMRCFKSMLKEIKYQAIHKVHSSIIEYTSS